MQREPSVWRNQYKVRAVPGSFGRLVFLIGLNLFAQGHAAASFPQETLLESDVDYIGESHTCDWFTYQPEGDDGDAVYRAFLYRPVEVKPGVSYPLVVWLHGAGAYEFKNRMGPLKHIAQACHEYFGNSRKTPFFMLVPSLSEGSWFEQSQSERDMLWRADWLMEKTIQELPIDPDRVTLIGISAGATACWEWVGRRPERFAAVAPISRGSSDVSRLTNTGRTPIWAFARLDDPIRPQVEASVDRVRSNGGVATVTLFPGEDHDAWNPAFREHDVFRWLVSKSRNDPAYYLPPGYSSAWSYVTSFGVPIGIVLAIGVLGFACSKELRRRKNRLSESNENEQCR